MMLAGPTQSGKTVFLTNLLYYSQYIEPKPTKVIWCYGIKNVDQFTSIYEKSKFPVEFRQGLPDLEEIPKNTILVLDDLMEDAGKSKNVSSFFTKGMHHKEISVILLVQNVFHQGKEMRSISLNCKYIVLFKNPRDTRQIQYLALQIFPQQPKFIPDAYKQATERPYGYLIIDLTQTTEENMRLLTNIFPNEKCYYFIPMTQ